MGFKCPICLKDFANDKAERDKHCAEKHAGVGQDIIELVVKTAEAVRP